jgi:predicted nucleic acid-binding protein
MFVVDTNILIYAADADSPDHAKCRSAVEAWRKQSSPWHVTWGVVYEFLRVATDRNVFRKPFTLSDAWSFH